MSGTPMEPIRPIFWNIREHYHWAEIGQYVLGSLAVLIFLWGVYRHFARWRTGKPETVLPAWPARIRALIQFALLQGRLASDRYALGKTTASLATQISPPLCSYSAGSSVGPSFMIKPLMSACTSQG